MPPSTSYLVKNYVSFKFPRDVSHFLPYFKTNLSYYCCLCCNESSVLVLLETSALLGHEVGTYVMPYQQVTEAQEDGRPATMFCSVNFVFTTYSRTSRRRKPGDPAALLSPPRPDTTFYRSVILLLNKTKGS